MPQVQKARVFVSYSRKDTDFAKRLVKTLTKDARDVWVDWEDIPRAADWLQEIYTGIEGADTFILIVSQHSLISEICNYEIAHARKHNKRIIPVIRQRIEGDIDTFVKGNWYGKEWQSIADDNWKSIGHLNWLFFDNDDNFDEKFADLLQTVDTDLAHVKLHTRLLIRAREWEQNSQSISFLAGGDELVSAETWLTESEDKEPLPTDLHRSFIEMSRKTEDEREARARRLQNITRAASVAVLILIIVAIGVAAFSFVTVRDTNNLRVDTQNFADAVQLAIRAQDTANRGEPELGLRLALEASYIDDAPLIQNILGELAYAPGEHLHHLDGRYSLRQSVTTAIFSADGQYILYAVGFAGGITISLMDLDSGEILHSFSGLYEASYSNLELSHDGTHLLTSGAQDGSIYLRNIVNGEQIQRFTGHSDTVNDMVFSADSQMIASGADDGIVILWDALNGQLLQRFEGHSGSIRTVAFSPDSLRVLSGGDSSSGELILWNVENTEIIFRFEGHTGIVTSIEFSADGQMIVSGADDGMVILWDATTGQQLQRLEGHSDNIRSVTFSSDGYSIISRAQADSIQLGISEIILWDIETGNILERALVAEWLYDTFEYDNGQLMAINASGGETQSGELILNDIFQGNIIYRRVAHDDIINEAKFSPDNRFIVANSDNTIIIWNTSGQELQRIMGLPEQIYTVEIHPDGQSITAISQDEIITMDITTGSILEREPRIGWSGNSAVLIEDDSGSNISVTFNGEVYSIKEIFTAIETNYVALNPDGQTIFVAGGACTVIMAEVVRFGDLVQVDLETGEELQRYIGHGCTVNDIALSEDATTMVSGSENNTVIIWDVDSGDIIYHMEGHADAVNSVAFSPDEQLVVSGSADGTVIVWDVANGEQLRHYTGHNDSVSSVAFSPDGNTIVSSSDDGTIILWGYDTLKELQQWVLENRYLPELTCQQRTTYGLSPCVDGIPPAREG